MTGEIEQARERCLRGEPLDRESILRLLEIPLGSEQDRLLRRTAREVAAVLTGNRGYLWCAIGADFQPCPMNCAFCSLGEKWGIVREGRTYTDEELLGKAARFAGNGADFIVLRTTEFFSIEALSALTRRMRREIPGDYDVVLNVGEFDLETANAMHAAGIGGIYHALRLREGRDTPFEPSQRLATMESVHRSPLNLISLVEPIGPEHTNEEIADRFLTAVANGAYISGAMARVPVPGTPLGNQPALLESRLAQIIAVLRLSGGSTVRDICVHPASAEAAASGANVVVVETGAIPRDTAVSTGEWEQFGMDAAKALLREAGYDLGKEGLLKAVDCPACRGKNLDKFIQPIILSVLEKNGGITGYRIIQEMGGYATFRESTPDATGIYRYLKIMQAKGLIGRRTAPGEGDRYYLTYDGRHCLASWKETLCAYSALLTRLSDQL